MELGGEAFGRQLDHQGRVLRNEISVLIKKSTILLSRQISRTPPPPCENRDKGQQSATWKSTLTRTWPCWHPDLGLVASKM